MKEIKLLWNFLLNPTSEKESSNFITNLSRFLVVLLINVAAVSIVVCINYGLKQWGLIDIKILPGIANLNIYLVIAILISLIFITPVIEELAFRLHLLPHKRNIKISVIVLIVYLTIVLAFISKSILAAAIISALGGILLISYFVFQKKINDGIKEIWTNKFRSVFYSTALVFGGLHIFNHQLSVTNLMFAPIIVAPQIILGLNVGYLRVKSGFKWGLLLHIIHNFLFVGVLIYFINPGLFDIKKMEFIMDYPAKSIPPKNYTLMIGEGKEDPFHTYKVTPNDISFENTKMKEVFIQLANASNAKVIFENPEIENKIINLSFINKSEKKSSIRNNSHLVIEELFKKYHLKAKLYMLPEGYWILTPKMDPDQSISKTLIPDQNDTNKETISMQDATVEELAAKIVTLYSFNCVALINNPNKYNFKIPKNDAVALQKVLLGKYGFKFYKLKTKTDIFYISSRND